MINASMKYLGVIGDRCVSVTGIKKKPRFL
jgi:hypothetical protein